MIRLVHIAGAVLLIGILSGCRGMDHGQPPIHPNLNMDMQERFDPQERNSFFSDNRSMRPLVAGTVARGFLREDQPFYLGRVADGAHVTEYPVALTRELLVRGQERYNIYCSPCHGMAGDGTGIITTGGYGYTPAPTYHTDRLRTMSVGEMFDVITNGVRTMPPYAAQVSVVDRWAIVAYVRALQRSQNASRDDIPEQIWQEMGQRASSPAAAPPAEEAERADTVAADTAASVE